MEMNDNRTGGLIFEKSRPGRRSAVLPETDAPKAKDLPGHLTRPEPAALPEISEMDLVRHFTNLSRLNFSVDTHFYPLGSCTMKYNVKALEQIAALPGFIGIHPALAGIPGGDRLIQGSLEVLATLERNIAELTGMDAVTCQPLAGAHGEMTGIMLVAAYHRSRGNRKTKVIVPDSSHGTNPASAAMAGYEIVTIPSNARGEMDIDEFRKALTPDVAAVMMTCPNTLGIFESRIRDICDLAHAADALMYYDGANLNAIMGKMRPGDAGFDVVHVNVHKTFGTPHGGGGPGAGPVGVKRKLIPFLPVPRLVRTKTGYQMSCDQPDSIGRVSGYFGNFSVLLKACAYLTLLGRDGLVRATEQAVLNANYIMTALKPYYTLPYDRTCLHECVFSAEKQNATGIHAIDIAKALIDRGFHPPTVYFPLIVKEAVMIEPTETESRETLDTFIEAMKEIARAAETDPQSLKNAPVTTPVTRLDETKAAREMRLRCFG